MAYVGNPIEGSSVDFRFCDYLPTTDTNETLKLHSDIKMAGPYNPSTDADVMLGLKKVDPSQNTAVDEAKPTKPWWQFW